MKIMLLGSGELGKEIVVEAQRLGFITIAVDRYEGAPAQHMADIAYSGNMTEAGFLRYLVKKEKPDFIIPEIESINLDALREFEEEGIFVSPRAEAQRLAMDRFKLREALHKAGVNVSAFHFCSTFEEFRKACADFNYNCVTKARFSSSGHGSYVVKPEKDMEHAWEERRKARKPPDNVIVEEYIPFSCEANQLVLRAYNENMKMQTFFCKTIGHYQIYGDYHSSWQPLYRSEEEQKKFEAIKPQVYELAQKAALALGGKGRGIFAVEQFLDYKNKKVYVNEVSCRPHDTGMVTFKTHYPGYSESGLHLRAVTNIPIEPKVYKKIEGKNIIDSIKPGASHVIVSPVSGWNPKFKNIEKAMKHADIWIFKKPYAFHEEHHGRRLGLALAMCDTVSEALSEAERAAHTIEIRTNEENFKKQWLREKHLVFR